MDCLLIVKQPWSSSSELRFLFECLSASPNSHSTYVLMLQNKIDSGPTPLQSAVNGSGVKAQGDGVDDSGGVLSE